jgi:methanogenic corrinoid protein MtbC1
MSRTLLDAVLEDLRERVVERVARATPDLPALGGAEGLRRDVAELLEHLSVAVELDAPRLFVAHVRWTRALAGRGAWGSLLGRCLEAIEEELRDRVGPPGAVAEVRRECLRQALEAIAAARSLPAPRPEAAREVAAYLAEAQGGRRDAALARVEQWRQEEGPVAALQHLAAAQREAGERWFTGEISVVVEHRITAVSEAALHRLAPPPGRNGRAVFACAPGDFHAMGPALAAAFLGHRGWEVESLGVSTPAAGLGRFVREAAPDVVGIGVGPLVALPGARDAARAVRAARPEAVLVAGGWAARVAGAGLLGVDRVEGATYGGEPPVHAGPAEPASGPASAPDNP